MKIKDPRDIFAGMPEIPVYQAPAPIDIEAVRRGKLAMVEDARARLKADWREAKNAKAIDARANILSGLIKASDDPVNVGF
jgi:hypothetical protein